MSELPFATPAEIGSADVLTIDTECRRCGYNLRGLSPNAVCPECATPVGLSVHGDLLRFANPEWLYKLSKGINWILWGLAIAFVTGMAAGVAGAMTGNKALLGIVAFLGGLVGYYGAYLLTEPDPSGLGEDQYGKRRKFIRIALMIGLGSALVNLVGMMVRETQLALTVIGATSLVAGLFGAAGEIAKLTYLAELARRIPDHRLISRGQSLARSYGVTLILVTILGAVAAVLALSGNVPTAAGPGTKGTELIIALGCVVLVLNFVLLVLFLFVLRYQYRMGQAFRAQAEIARQTWATAGVSAMR